METVGERIKVIRLDQGLTQEKFCERIGLKRNSISLVESGKRGTTEPVLRAICHEYSVSRVWLETGEGEMYEPLPEGDAELIESMADVLSGAGDKKKKIIAMAMQLPDNLADQIIDFLAERMAAEKKDRP